MASARMYVPVRATNSFGTFALKLGSIKHRGRGTNQFMGIEFNLELNPYFFTHQRAYKRILNIQTQHNVKFSVEIHNK